ncbi:MAG TPA: CHASE3 domain-containing protein [Bacteroidales bacterium]|nr:CHASE3 domain-containing protein [Bacteroidales bacterium]
MKFLRHNLASIVLVTVLAVSIFFLLYAAGVSYRQIRMLRETQESVVRSYKIYVELEQLKSFASDAETGQRGFLLTGDSIFLHPYYEALEKIKWSFARLSVLTENDYSQNKSLDTLVYLLNQRLKFLDDVISNRQLNVEASDTLRTLLYRGREMMSLSLSKIDKMVFEELQILRQKELEHRGDTRFSPYSILFVVLFSVIVFVISFYKINRDLREKDNTNNQLIISNKIFEHSEQIADISHWYWDIKENKMTYSVNLYRLLGCKINEFEPTFDNFLQYVHPSDRHLLTESKKKALTEMSPYITQFRVIRKDGEIRQFKSTGKLITDNYGKSFSIFILADITDQFKKDKMLVERLADLEKSNKQLSAFSHIASHDLQEPLRKVQTFISRIKQSEMVNIPDNIREYLQGIKKETIRMQKFITDLLLYSRASKADKTFEMADLNEILENSKRELSHRIEEKNVIINSSSDLPSLNVIPFQIQQLFSNLLSNSIKYSRDEVRPMIDITSDIVHGSNIINYNGDPESRFHKISFTDNGIGFDQQYAEKIFTLFYRLHNNREYTGTGIGLAICKIIAENHKGYINAFGVPGSGSVFNVYLPDQKQA